MSRSHQSDLASQHADRLCAALDALRDLPAEGAREVAALLGLNARGECSEPIDNIVLRAAVILLATGQIFRFGNAIVLHKPGDRPGQPGELVPLADAGIPTPIASGLLSNLLQVQDNDRYFPMPASFLRTLFLSELFLSRIPRIDLFETRSTFDRDVVLRGPGWHPGVNILVSGLEIDAEPLPEPDPSLPARERLPPHLRRLLGDFAFRTDADLVHALAILLTGLLVEWFREPGKPIAMIDGNQPGLGKTLLIHVIAEVLDGQRASLISYSKEDYQLEQKLATAVQDSSSHVILIDNARVPGGRIDHPVLESQSVAPVVSFRRLGGNTRIERPNNLIFAITMNDARATRDLASRALVIQLFHEGPAEQRDYDDRDPIAYAREHRAKLLGELVAMVDRWDEAGRPMGTASHRLREWCRTISGILVANGFTELLANTGNLSELDEDGEILTALAETAITRHLTAFLARSGDEPGGQPAGNWAQLCRDAQAWPQGTSAVTAPTEARGFATKMGSFLIRNLNRILTVFTSDGLEVRTRLVRRGSRGRQTRYAFLLEGCPPAVGEPHADSAPSIRGEPDEPSNSGSPPRFTTGSHDSADG